MMFPKTFSEMPVGPYIDIAAIYLTTQQIAILVNTFVISGDEDLGEFERILFRDGEVGFVLTTFKGFAAPISLLATNTFAPEIQNIMAIFLEKFGLANTDFRYEIIERERELILKSKW